MPDESPEHVARPETVRAAKERESARILEFVTADQREGFGFKEWLRAA
jgi:hypothetical protein